MIVQVNALDQLENDEYTFQEDNKQSNTGESHDDLLDFYSNSIVDDL